MVLHRVLLVVLLFERLITLQRFCVGTNVVKPVITNPSILLSLDEESGTRWQEKKEIVLSWDANDKYTDAEVGMTEYVRKKGKGLGGILKSTWSDFRVHEIRQRDGLVVELNNLTLPTTFTPNATYLRFTLAKAGYDTISAIGRIATFAQVGRHLFSYAGIKDKSAVTTQEVTVKVSPASMKDLCSRLLRIGSRFPRIRIGTLQPCTEPLTPGANGGNLFTILLREISPRMATPKRLRRRLKSVGERGFINYYGHQRFGLGMRSCMPTILVGKALLQGRFEEAVALIMSPEGATDAREGKVKRAFSAGWARLRCSPSLDASTCTDTIPTAGSSCRAAGGDNCGSSSGGIGAAGCSIHTGTSSTSSTSRTSTSTSGGCNNGGSGDKWSKERWREAVRALAQEGLKELPTHCYGECSLLHALSRGSPLQQAVREMPHRSMYMLAYWSWIWNDAASHRLHRYGGRAPVPGDLVCAERSGSMSGWTRRGLDQAMDVHVVTKEDVTASKYSMWDLVLPLPGRAVHLRYPDNKTGRHMRRLLRREGMAGAVCDPSPREGGRATQPRECLFRFLLQRPVALEWEILAYRSEEV